MKVVTLLLVLLLTACASGPTYHYRGGEMIPGRLISLADGTLLPMQLELSTGSGRITAFNPVTNEKFSGNYTAVSEDKYIQYSKPSFWGSENTVQAVEMSSSVPATAIIVGDQGTVINIRIRIRPGNAHVLPIGYGDAEDNKGVKYNFQF
jgi:hypothetical protein